VWLGETCLGNFAIESHVLGLGWKMLHGLEISELASWEIR
jgi:hypothetical protein